MKLIVFKFDVEPVYNELLSQNSDMDFESYDKNYIAELAIISMLYNHCILMITEDAYAIYNRANWELRNRIDQAVESCMLDREIRWIEFARMVRNVITIRKVRHRRKQTFEVYCD